MSDSGSDAQRPPAQPTIGYEPGEATHRGMTRRGWTIVLSFAVVALLALIGGFVKVPYVSVGPGPTYNTLGSVDGQAVVEVDGRTTYPTSGELRMTTVSINDDVTLFGALGLWASGRYALAPRDEYYGPGQTQEDLERQNTKMFQNSQSAAETAALRLLKEPVKVVAAEITKGAPADNVITPGDQLVTVNGTPIKVQEDVRAALKGTKPGQTVSVTLKHEDQPAKTVDVKLGKAADFSADDKRSEGFLGVAPVDRADVNYETTIHLEDVGGPSAGLIFALAIVDTLTPGELEAGRNIAGTGAIDVKGNVQEIGGIPFKLIAAKEDGATAFLVPAGNCAEAKSNAPDGLELIKVSTLAEAVEAIEDLDAGREPAHC